LKQYSSFDIIYMQVSIGAENYIAEEMKIFAEE
jgi:hypothetical protein